MTRKFHYTRRDGTTVDVTAEDVDFTPTHVAFLDRRGRLIYAENAENVHGLSDSEAGT